jgi:hypothetical protein
MPSLMYRTPSVPNYKSHATEAVYGNARTGKATFFKATKATHGMETRRSVRAGSEHLRAKFKIALRYTAHAHALDESACANDSTVDC